MATRNQEQLRALPALVRKTFQSLQVIRSLQVTRSAKSGPLPQTHAAIVAVRALCTRYKYFFILLRHDSSAMSELKCCNVVSEILRVVERKTWLAGVLRI